MYIQKKYAILKPYRNCTRNPASKLLQFSLSISTRTAWKMVDWFGLGVKVKKIMHFYSRTKLLSVMSNTLNVLNIFYVVYLPQEENLNTDSTFHLS
jgi:hypothetical protein